MKLHYVHDDGNQYHVTTVEHIEHGFEHDGLDYTPMTELLYGYHISGNGLDFNSLAEPPANEHTYQCWDNEDDALVEGLKQLLKELATLDRKREEQAA